MRRSDPKGPRAATVAVIGGLVLLGAWLSAADFPAQVGVAPQPGGVMKHQELFRGAKPEWGPVNDPRLKPEIRYAAIGNDAVIEGDIVIGKVDEIRPRKFYSLVEEAREAGHVDDLGLTKEQKAAFEAVRKVELPKDFAEAAKARRKSRALRLLADLVRSEAQSKGLAGYPTQEIDALRKAAPPGAGPMFAVIQVGARFRWPNGIIPYEIDPSAPNQQGIQQAIDHWHTMTDKIHLRPRQSVDQDYVRFVAGGGCSSPVGRVGGEQVITLAAGCGFPQIVHEIGHAVGLWHQQCSNNRDLYLEIHDENVDPTMLFNFDLAGALGQDIGPFDFASIMLYPPWAFSDNGQPTMVSRWPQITGPPPGRWGVGSPDIVSLSAGDLNGVNAMYSEPANPPNPRHPAGAPVASFMAAPIPPGPPPTPQRVPGTSMAQALAPLPPPGVVPGAAVPTPGAQPATPSGAPVPTPGAQPGVRPATPPGAPVPPGAQPAAPTPPPVSPSH